VTISNYPAGQTEYFEIANNPEDEQAGMRKVAFTRELFIERGDFAEVPPPKFQRLRPQGEVRLMGAYLIRCDEIIKDANGEITELLCSCDLETRNNMPADGRKVRGTVHWVSAEHAVDAEIRLYDNLFTLEDCFGYPGGQDLQGLPPSCVARYLAGLQA
jgi:glutaminyl-tRNA synthetase